MSDSKPASRASMRIAFVPPRYGDHVVGGAEAVIRETAHGFAALGWEVDVLTTCARDHFSWANEYPAGDSHDGAITIRRFPTVVPHSRAERARYEGVMLSGGALTLEEQQRWVNGDLRVPELFHHVLDHASEYRALVFAPYMFWTTFACTQVAPMRTILMPCLHDEPYASLDIFRPMFSGAAGIWFLSEPEHEIAHRLFALPDNHRVVGSGVRIPAGYDTDGFRARHGIDGRFVLFAGRREAGKGWDDMLNAFAAAVQRHALPFSLVTMGTGDVNPPPSIRDSVIDLGFVPDAERDAAFAAADAYIQPSPYESFSRTMMEAWLAGTPVIANGTSEVVRWHCERSGAGLTYDDEYELAQCLDFVAHAPEAAACFGERGRDYVLRNYAPESVLRAQEASLREWLPDDAGDEHEAIA